MLLQFFSFLELTLLGLFHVFTGFGLPAPSGLFHCAGWPPGVRNRYSASPHFRPCALPPPFGWVQSADFACAFCAGFEAAPLSLLFLSLCFPACTSGAIDTRAILQMKLRNTLMNFLSGLIDVMGLLSAGVFVNANFTVGSHSCSALTKRNRGKKCSPSGGRGPYNLRSMKTNLLHRSKSNARAGEKRIESKSNLTILLLLFVALALAGCEGMESGSSGAASPWPAAPTGRSASPGTQTGFASGLSGRWYHDDRPTSIDVASDGRNLTVIDEVGRRTDGYATSPGEFYIPGTISEAVLVTEDAASHGQMAEPGRGNHTKADLMLGRLR